MAYSEFGNQVDPEVIVASIGNSWANETKFMRLAPQIFIKDTRPMMGTLLSTVRNTMFQGTSGQAVGAGSTIASVGRVQSKENHPHVWRYGSLDEDDIIQEVIVKGVEGAQNANAEYAAAAQEAGSQWLEDSLINIIEGTAAALTDNQAGSGATATLANLVAGKAALADLGTSLDGGASFCKSELYWMLVALGLVAIDDNTFGVAAHNDMVKAGDIVGNFLGSVIFPTDKLGAAPGTDHYFYFVGPQAIVLRANENVQIEMARKAVNGAFGNIMNLKVGFAAGFKGVNWSAAGSDSLSDADLATSGNWALADTDSKYVRVARVHTDNN